MKLRHVDGLSKGWQIRAGGQAWSRLFPLIHRGFRAARTSQHLLSANFGQVGRHERTLCYHDDPYVIKHPTGIHVKDDAYGTHKGAKT